MCFGIERSCLGMDRVAVSETFQCAQDLKMLMAQVIDCNLDPWPCLPLGINYN